MAKYWIRYEKGENVRYISHLDFLRTFNRLLRRSGVPVAYSRGFNPHPILNFALPLSVGLTSECEYLEIELDAPLPAAELMGALNAAAPPGLRILAAGEQADKKGFTAIARARYRMRPTVLPTSAQLAAFLGKSEIIMLKKTKSGEKETDIRPDILEAELLEDCLELLLSAGSARNVKPLLVMDAMEKYIDGYTPAFTYCHRLALLNEQGEAVVKEPSSAAE